MTMVHFYLIQTIKASISLNCLVAGEGVELPEGGSKNPKSSPPKKHSTSHLKIFTTAKLRNCNILEPDAARSAAERAEKAYKNANPAKARVSSSKCTRWVLVCINRCKNTATNAKEKGKSSQKAVNARHAMGRKSLKRKKP